MWIITVVLGLRIRSNSTRSMIFGLDSYPSTLLDIFLFGQKRRIIYGRIRQTVCTILYFENLYIFVSYTHRYVQSIAADVLDGKRGKKKDQSRIFRKCGVMLMSCASVLMKILINENEEI